MRQKYPFGLSKPRVMQILILALLAPLTIVSFQNCSSFKGNIAQLTTTSSLSTGTGSSSGGNAATPTPSAGQSSTPTPIPSTTATPTPTPAPTAVPTATPTPLPSVSQSTIFKSSFAPAVLPPGYPTTITYNWVGVPMSADYKVFVHVIGPDGKTVTQDDHGVYPQTTIWSGPLTYTRAIEVPAGSPDGVYHVYAGLWYPGLGQVALGAGPGVVGDSGNSYDIGTFTVKATASPPIAVNVNGAKTLDLSNYVLSFDDEFNGPLDVSPWGPNTKWISNKPDGQNFGWVGATNVFSIANGILDIQLTRDSNNNWAGGILSAVDGNGNGFAQQYGYFEARIKSPGTPGSWPAFWLLSQKSQQNSGQKLGLDVPAVEIDILEQYGSAPYQDITYHFWRSQGELYFALTAYITDMFADYHTYGVMIDEHWMVYYTDNVEVGRQATPPEVKQPFYPIVNLAIHDTNVANPAAVSHMYVDYVRVYKSK